MHKTFTFRRFPSWYKIASRPEKYFFISGPGRRRNEESGLVCQQFCDHNCALMRDCACKYAIDRAVGGGQLMAQDRITSLSKWHSKWPQWPGSGRNSQSEGTLLLSFNILIFFFFFFFFLGLLAWDWCSISNSLIIRTIISSVSSINSISWWILKKSPLCVEDVFL